MTVDGLKETRLGMFVNQIRKRCQDATIAAQGKDIVKKWQQLLPGELSNGHSQGTSQ
jgi:hypothetical protein